MENTLLIGNGLNYSLKDSISWGDLLHEVAAAYNVQYNGGIPMPLEFECIVNQYLSKQPSPTIKVYLEIKEKIAEEIRKAKLSAEAIHHELPSLPVSAVLTTNYDNLIEYAYVPDYSYTGTKSKKYLFDKTSSQDGVSFYHVHGHADSPKTICLGYEHYMGLVENMRSEINSGEKDSGNIKKIALTLLEPTKRRYTWYERFYTDNIGIIGLGLTESEVDLWWLLTHRAYLYYSNYYGIRKVLKNRIVYYDVLDESNASKLQEKKRVHYMLKNAHVEVKAFTIGKDCVGYEDAYRQILQNIRNGELSGAV